MNTKVPAEVSDIIAKFCGTIVPNQKPLYVDVKPEKYSMSRFCFQNVEQKIANDEGCIEYGWSIWIWDKVFLDAEFHAVWKSAKGNLTDVTPSELDVNKILFLPDRKRKYYGRQLDNIRYNLSNNGLVDLIIEVSECNYLFMNHGDRAEQLNIKLSGEELENFKALTNCKAIVLQMLNDNKSLNSKCICDSGLKFKHCCYKGICNFLLFIRKRYKI